MVLVDCIQWSTAPFELMAKLSLASVKPGFKCKPHTTSSHSHLYNYSSTLENKTTWKPFTTATEGWFDCKQRISLQCGHFQHLILYQAVLFWCGQEVWACTLLLGLVSLIGISKNSFICSYFFKVICQRYFIHSTERVLMWSSFLCLLWSLMMGTASIEIWW